MQTKRWTLKNDKINNKQVINMAASFLKKGLLVGFPTETVYGLGADATNEHAVAKIFKAKGRPQDNPLIAHVATKKQLVQLVSNLPLFAEKLIDAFMPGPLTVVLPSNGLCATNVTAGLSTVAIRIPSHPVAQQLLKQCGIPIAAPSANVSGKASPTTADHVWDDLSGKISGLLDDGPTGIGVESTVIDCTQELPIILRPGGITQEQLEAVVGPVLVDPGLTTGQPISPGQKYRHYSPEVPLWLINGSTTYMQSVIDAERNKGLRIGLLASTCTANKLKADKIVQLGDNIDDIASRLYEGLRSFSKESCDLIICETFLEVGLGQAVMNRLHKAASTYIQG